MCRPEPLSGTILQRIRLGEISPVSYQNEDFFQSGFDAALWHRAGRSCYWSADRSSEGIQHEAGRVRLMAGQELCADSYFNAFFAGYWRALTSLRTVGLRLRFSGRLSVHVLGHAASAGAENLVSAETSADASVWEIELGPVLLRESILRLSCSIRALSDQAEVLGGEWFTRDAPVRPVALAVITPTYNRPHFARKTVGDLLSDPHVAEVIHRIVVVEQSDQHELSDLEGAKCLRLRQPNWGCAGGVSRGLYECLQAEALKPATHFLLLDDDIMVEADSVLRAARFAAYANGNQVLGGGMLDLFKPNHAVALGESLERTGAGYHAISQVCPAADVGLSGTLDLASIPNPEGYCAWWFCLVPRSLVETIALPWAGFLRWDDINYGVRAAAAGYRSYMVPGIAVWHVPFYSKTVPWILYFDRYNELIQNALMSQAAVEAYLQHVIGGARNCARSGALAAAAAMTLAVEHYAAGWSHYASRTFPSFLGAVKTFVAGHEQTAQDGGDAQKKAAIDALLQRLQAAEVRCQSAAGALREAFAREIPGTYSVDSWRSFFQHGNLLGQRSDPPIIRPGPEATAMISLPLFRPVNEELLNHRRTTNCGPATILQQDLRARHLPRLLLIVAGYKSQLWPITLLRIKEHVPPETDVCVVCPGKLEPQLQGACAALGWSFLAIQDNKLSLAQNLAILLHPLAQWIHKLDEDIVIAAGYCETLEETYRHAVQLDEGQVGFVAPTLNVNGFSYRPFLKFVAPAKLLEFRARFGDYRSSCVNTAAWNNPAAAQFLWEQSLPFDPLAALFWARPKGYDICPHRFSIGAILFHRSLWEESGGFTVAAEGQLGVEESDLCAYCCDNAKLTLISHRTFAGHVGFFPQARHMIPWLSARDLNHAA